MLLRRVLAVALLALVAIASAPDAAGAPTATPPKTAPAAPSKKASVGSVVGSVLGFPFRCLGGQIVSGGADKLKGTIQDVDTRLTAQETQVNGLAQGLLTDAKGKVDSAIDLANDSLEARILQIKTTADDTVDRAMSEVNTTLRDRLQQLDAIGDHLVSNIGKAAKDALDHADSILRERSADIDRMADDLVTHADQAVKDRIDQIDEAAGRRLGDVDVIAAKQRIEFEETGIHLAVLIGLVVFVGFVLRGLWTRYAAMTDELEGVRGAARTALLARRLAPEVLLPLAAAAAGGLVLFALYHWLPMGAEHEAAQLAALHEKQLDESVARMDYAQARLHASDLQYLKPEEAVQASARAEKAGLLRDLVARPALLATQAAVTAFDARVRAVERDLGPRPDADLLVMHAIVAWESGASRLQEQRAASLAARALELSPRGFALSPIARAYVETFLASPYAPEDPEVGRDAATLDELSESLTAGPPDAVNSPFAPVAALARLMRDLDRASSGNYVQMVEAQAAIAVLTRDPRSPPDPIALAAAVKRRTEGATAVIAAWNAFDVSLGDTDGLDGPLVLDIFRLNDAVLTRALWYLAQPDTASQGERLEQVASPLLRIHLAPARVAWAQRYSAFFRGPAGQVAGFEESERFHAWEQWTLEFEQAIFAEALARAAGTEDGATRWRVVVAASALGLYVDHGDQRVPYARLVAGDLRQPADAARDATLQRTPDAPVTLHDALLVRGPRLI